MPILNEHTKAKNESSALSTDQKNELDRRMKLFEVGQMKTYEWPEVYQELKNKRKTKIS